jgi:branched-chain amino acid transport system ATP-binding protein
MTETLLTISDLQVSYGAVQVLFGVNLEVNTGEIVSIIGPNGAGKSTVIKSIVGLAPSKKGTIIFGERDITNQPAHVIPALGIGYVPQGRIVFAHMTVADNLELGAFLQRDTHKRREAVQTVFERFPRLYERRHQPAGKLSGGEQQMLAIGRALMMSPRLVILDEPSLGLSPKYVDQIFDQLLALKSQGRTLLMVEQNAARALELSDRGYAMELGHNRFTDSGEKLLANEDVRRMYLGGA